MTRGSRGASQQQGLGADLLQDAPGKAPFVVFPPGAHPRPPVLARLPPFPVTLSMGNSQERVADLPADTCRTTSVFGNPSLLEGIHPKLFTTEQMRETGTTGSHCISPFKE